MPRNLMTVLLLPLLFTLGCEPTVVQYRKKPSYYQQMAGASFRDGMTDEGVEIRWEEPSKPSANPYEQVIGKEVFRIREEQQDGTVIIQAKLPQHVLVNTLTCLRNNEYQLLWDQMLARSTRDFYERQEDGYVKYEAHLRKHRKGMAALVNRMIVGKTFGEVETQKADDGTIRCRLRKKLRRDFEFKEVLMVSEDRNLKLLTIR
ncbi:MAG: hypothetical protein MK089_11905 [Phycisphaerales bacterium]|nr:hypothetical protein [Phycisphaerales bacterium]